MNWLLWKEFRLQRMVLVVGLLLLLAPYAAPLIAYLRHSPTAHLLMGIAVVSSFVLATLTFALLGGNAIASEKVDRSSEFQAYLPIPRWSLLLSKLAPPLVAAILAWGINWTLFALTPSLEYPSAPGYVWLVRYMLMGLSAFGIAWLFSSLQRSPTFAVGAGILVPVFVAVLLAVIFWAIGIPPGSTFENTWTALMVIGGLASFLAGSWHFLHAVER